MSLRSPLGRVLGLGAAKEGVSHWWAQRVGSVALVVLSLWFLGSLLLLGQVDFDSMAVWIAGPVHAVLLILLVITMVRHSQLGIQVVVEDYVHDKGRKIVTMMIVNALHIVVGAIGVLAILRVALGGVE